MTWNETDLERAEKLLDLLHKAKVKIATAESCTGGLIGALLTSVPGSSHVFDRGFITYSNEAKIDMLGVNPLLIERHGAVSEPVAIAMAEGALRYSSATLSLSVTGIAGPGGGSPDKPVGLVHFACAQRNGPARHVRCLFEDQGRHSIRLAALRQALALFEQSL